MGSLSRHTHPEGGAEDSLERRPCLFRRKGWTGREFFEKAKGIGGPRERFSSLGGAWICGGRENVLWDEEGKRLENILFLATAAQEEVLAFREVGGGWVGIGREFGRRQLTCSCLD